jgi:hypothetical protein
MRLLTMILLGLAVGCGSTLGRPDGGGGTTGQGGSTGEGGTTGSGGAACVRNGETYRPGSSVPSGDCNSCFCSETGQIGCTLIACPPDAGTCAFDATYRYGDNGGFVAYEDVATLTPPTSYSYARTSHVTTPPSSACAPPMPPCGWEDIYGPSDVMRAINHPDVQAALAMATPPTYGVDARPVDGQIFQFLRGDGHGFLAGYPCPGGSQTGCVDPPAGVTGLVNLLRALDEQQLRDPSCAALR